MFKKISTQHKDLIHDVAYNFHGKRMATCSSDHSVKIWNLVEDTWKCTAELRGHCGSIWRVTWAHPEFGQVLATCSFDRTAQIWEELAGNQKAKGQATWVKRSSQVDSRTSVTDVKFAPRHLGLQLATCSADGVVRVYEALDIMNLSNWALQHEINCKLSCSSISWNPSRMHTPMIAVGSDDNNQSAGGKVLVYEYIENTRKWNKVATIVTITDSVKDVSFSPNLGRSFHTLAVASKDVNIVILKPISVDPGISQQSSNKYEIQQPPPLDTQQSQVWCVRWNVTGTILASSGDDGCVRLWKANYLNKWRCIATLPGEDSSSTSVLAMNTPNGKQNLFTSTSSNTSHNSQQLSVRYQQNPPITNSSQVPWH